MKTFISRRTLLRDAAMVAAGVVAGRALPHTALWSSAFAADAKQGGAEQRLRELGVELPPVSKPLAVYVPSVQVGETLYVSGTGPRKADGSGFITGKVGRELSLDEAQAAARLTGLNILSIVRNALGSLDKVERLVKVLGMVNCTTDFTDQPLVVNGFSELMVEVFGEEAGKAARSAVGMGSLPGNIPIEIEAIFQVRQ